MQILGILKLKQNNKFEKKWRQDPDLNREFRTEPAFQAGAIPDYAILAKKKSYLQYLFNYKKNTNEELINLAIK